MNLSPSDIYSFYRPSKCERRVFLRAHDEPEAEPSEFDKLIEELGRRHEQNHFASFPKFEDLSAGSIDVRITRTKDAIERKIPVIYQGVLTSVFPGTPDTIVGIPDFLINDGDTYKIRDCKLSRHAEEDRHPEILRQLEMYGWLFESTFKKPPSFLEAYLGDESIVQIPFTGATPALDVLAQIRAISLGKDEPFSPVGWSKCGQCGFRSRCWGLAETSDDLALVYELDQGTAIALRQQGITNIKQLLSRFDEQSLSELRKPRGKQMVRIGKAATRILLQAEALQSKQEKLISPLVLPTADNLVMFDLEGLPPQFDELDKIYLWGTQVFGVKPGRFMAALAGFGSEGDKEGWDEFLSNCQIIFAEYGDIPFIHWHHYETTKVRSYIDRYGDHDGIAQRVLDNCADLLKITRDSLVLPEYSYSLKVIEKRAGFKRTMNEFGGDWSIVQYIRAVETNDQSLRDQIMSEILKYNEEDLQATWTVFQWLKTKG